MHWGRRVLIVAAHPDDEVIGAGGQFRHIPEPTIVHATDGAPRDMVDARAYGFATRAAYAEARRAELLAALRLAGIGAERQLSLGFADQEAAFHMSEAACRLSALLRRIQPDTLLVPAYEGGHPDHDSVAFSAHAACRIYAQEAGSAPAMLEYALYHAWAGGIRTGHFLPNGSAEPVDITLHESDKILKQRMLECFVTQRNTLSPFQTDCERFRAAPAYDFAAPPHEGQLYYENFSWGVTGGKWRELARDAAAQLKVSLS